MIYAMEREGLPRSRSDREAAIQRVLGELAYLRDHGPFTLPTGERIRFVFGSDPPRESEALVLALVFGTAVAAPRNELPDGAYVLGLILVET